MNDADDARFLPRLSTLQIASGTTQHTRYVIECGAIPIFVRILMSPSEEVREQAVWALGNIAGDHPTTRGVVAFKCACLQGSELFAVAPHRHHRLEFYKLIQAAEQAQMHSMRCSGLVSN